MRGPKRTTRKRERWKDGIEHVPFPAFCMSQQISTSQVPLDPYLCFQLIFICCWPCSFFFFRTTAIVPVPSTFPSSRIKPLTGDRRMESSDIHPCPHPLHTLVAGLIHDSIYPATSLTASVGSATKLVLPSISTDSTQSFWPPTLQLSSLSVAQYWLSRTMVLSNQPAVASFLLMPVWKARL